MAQNQFSYEDVLKAEKMPSTTGLSYEDLASGQTPEKPAEAGFIPTVKRTAGQMMTTAATSLEDVTGQNAVTKSLSDTGQGIIDRNPAGIKSLSDVVDKPWLTVKESLGQFAPQIGAAAAGGAAGAALGSLAGPVGTAIGGAVGGLLPIFTQEYGGIRQDQIASGQEDKGRALMAAIPATALERVGMGKALKVLKGVPIGAGSIAKEVGKGVLKEGATEGAQNVIEQVGAFKDPTTSENLGDTGLAAVMGGIGGGIMGGAGGAVDHLRNKSTETRDTAPGQEAPPAAPLSIGNTPDPLISFRDGSVARQSEVDTYLNSLPEEQRVAARAKLMGLAAQPVDIGTSPGANAPQTLPAAPPDALQTQGQPAPVEPPTDAERTAQLEEKLAFVQQQAQANGWDQRLIGARDEATAELDALRIKPVDIGALDIQLSSTEAPSAGEYYAPGDTTNPLTGERIPDQRTPSQRMGIDPAAGPNSKAAALALDSGASDQMQAQALAEKASIATKSGASNQGQANERPINQPSAGLLPLGSPAGNDAGRGVGVAGAVPRDAGRRDAGASLSSLASNGKLGSAPAGQRGNGNAPLTPSNFSGTPSATMGATGPTAQQGPSFGTKDAFAAIRASKQAVQPQGVTSEPKTAQAQQSIAQPTQAGGAATAGPAAATTAGQSATVGGSGGQAAGMTAVSQINKLVAELESLGNKDSQYSGKDYAQLVKSADQKTIDNTIGALRTAIAYQKQVNAKTATNAAPSLATGAVVASKDVELADKFKEFAVSNGFVPHELALAATNPQAFNAANHEIVYALEAMNAVKDKSVAEMASAWDRINRLNAEKAEKETPQVKNAKLSVGDEVTFRGPSVQEGKGVVESTNQDGSIGIKTKGGVYKFAPDAKIAFTKTEEKQPAPKLGQLPPVAAAMIQAGIDAASDLRDRVSNVRLGELGEKYETIAFEFDGVTHTAELKGRNRDLVVFADGRESDKGIAVRAILDGDSTVKAKSPQPAQPVTPQDASAANRAKLKAKNTPNAQAQTTIYEQAKARRGSSNQNQAAAPSPSAQGTPTADRHPNWRKNAIQAGRVARELGLEPKGKRLAQIVAEVDTHDAEQNQAVAPAIQAPTAIENVAPTADELKAEAPARPTTAQKDAEKTAPVESPAKPAEFTHNGTRIYQVNIKRGDAVAAMWGVESAVNKAKREAGERTIGGDSLHETRDAAIKAAEREAKSNAQSEAYRKEREETAQKEKAAKEAKAADTINGFTEGMAPNTAALAAKALEKEVRFKGEVASIRSFIDKWHEAGTLEVSTTQEPRIKPMSRTAYNRADNKAQDEHERRMKEAGNKTVYWVNDIDLGKIAHDYAQHMLEQEAKPVDGFVESDAAESDYASTAEQVEAAKELLLPIRQGETITDDDRQTLESLLKIPSLNGFDQPTARRLLMIAGATKAAIEKVMRTNPVSIDDLATELGKATGEAEKKKAFDRAFNAASQIAQTDPKVKDLLDIYNLEKSILDGIASERGLYGTKWAERNVSSRWTGQSQKVRSVKQRLVDAVNKAAPSGVRQGLAGARAKKAAETANPKPTDSAYHYSDGNMGMTSGGSFTADKSRWMTFTKSEAERMVEGDVKPYGATRVGMFVGIDSGVRLEAVAQPKPVKNTITPEDVAAAEKQAIAVIEKRIDAMKAGALNAFAKKFLPTMGMKALVSKERNKAMLTDASKVNLLGVAGELGVELAPSVRKALEMQLEGRVESDSSKPMFSRAPGKKTGKAISTAKRDEAFSKWSNNAPLVTSAEAPSYNFKSGEKIVVEAFHGTKRPDRIGGVFDPKRATSGPMAFFTSSPELASSYSTNKTDTSLADEDQSFENWFRYKPAGQRSEVDIARAWYSLTPEQKATIAQRMPDIRTNDDGDIIYEKGGGDIGSYEWELKQTQRGYDKQGNPLKAAVETWLTSGSLFDSELEFVKVLQLAGFPVQDLRTDFPTDEFPSVFKTVIAMQKPLVVSDMPAEVLAALEQKAKTDRTRAQVGADNWDKRSRTVRQWVDHLNGKDGADSTYAWTSIPDKVTDVLKSFGYDGIVDWSGKGGGHQHPVYIPFASTQVKGAFNRGTYDPTKKDINFSRAPAISRADSNARNVATQMLVDGLTEKWTRVPEIIVARNMDDPQIPQDVRDYDAELKSQGSDGDARGFIYRGKVYLLSDQLKGPEQIAEVLFHEVLGHYGLRAVFGQGLTPILQQLGTMRRRDVVAKAREYGLFDKDALGGLDKKTASDAQIWAAMSAKDRLSAAEEVLAEMAQTQPTIGFVKRAIALIRNWLRANVPGFKSLRLTDADIVAGYILPARGFVTRSQETPKQSIERAMLAFSRVWHGSPHKFDKFDSSKIGTGEGAQAYGHGLYLAESPDVAKSYQAMSYNRTVALPDGKGYALFDSATDKKISDTFGTKDAALKAKEAFSGNHYQVDLPDDQIAKMLDWDKRISQQPQGLIDAIAGSNIAGLYGTKDSPADWAKLGLNAPAQLTARDVYHTLSQKLGGDAAASQWLKDAGIPGIRYLDGGSRGRSGGELVDVFQSSKGWQAKIRKDGSQVSGQIGDIIPQASQITTSMPFKSEQEARQWAQQQIGAGTSNYVIFPGMEKILTIIDVNGEPVTGAEKAKVLGEQMDMAFSRAPQSRSAAIKEMLDAQAAWDKMKKGDAENITLEKFSEMTDRSINARTALADELVSMPDDGFALQAKTSDGRMLILTPSAQKAGKWQLTRFGSDGTPWGDTNFDTKKQAALEFIDEADLKTIQGADNEGAAFSRTPGDQTQTEAFKRWFAGSRVVDADGKPLVVYHGTAADIDAFDLAKSGSLTRARSADGAFWFSDSPELAGDYAALSKKKLGKNGARNVMPVFLKMENPKIVDMAGKSYHELAVDFGGMVQTARKGVRSGTDWVVPPHDGMILRNFSDTPSGRRLVATHYVAFHPEQIKSAIGNSGAFDPASPDIRFSRTSTAGVAARMGDAIKSVTVQSVKDKASYKKADWLGLGLQTLGRRQIVDIYGKDLPQLNAYNKLAAQMEADKNEVGAEADQLAQRWGKVKDEKALAELMHDATLAQIDPDKGYVAGDNKLQHSALSARFNRLSDEAKQVYRDARAAYEGHHSKVREAIKQRIMRSELMGERRADLLKRMDDEFFKKTKGVYFPLARFGQYVVAVKGPDGKIASVNRAETMAEAQALRASLVKAFPPSSGHEVVRPTLSKEFIASRDAVGRGFMTELYGALEGVDMGAAERMELEDTLGQLYLSSLPDLSWAKHGIHRKGTPGFSQDARRAFAQNMFHGGRYLAKLRYADLMQSEITDMQKMADDWKEVEDFDQPTAQRVVDEMQKRHESLMNPKSNPLSSALTSFGFVFFLGLSPASALVNLSQTALVAYPVMASKWGFDKSAAALLRASKQAAMGKNDITGSLNAEERAAYDEAVRAGTIDVTMAHDLAGIAQGEDSGVMWKIRPVMRWASFMFHHAERFNRQVTFIAAYRLAKDAGSDAKTAFEQATDATYKGHFDYSSGNRARIMQGNTAKVLLLFKQYGQNMIYTLARSAQQAIKGETPEARREARRALTGLLVMHGLGAGTLGLPLVTTLLAAASMIGGDDDEPWDAKVALQNMLADAFGQKPAEVLMHGLSRLTPWDISGRVGLDRLILPDVQEGLEGQRLAESAMTAALGPVAGIGVNVLKGIQDMSNGQFARGLEGMLPAAVRNGAKAIRYANEGAQDKSGIIIKDEVNPAEVIGQALGFSPSSVRNASEGKSAVLDFDRELTRRRGHLLTEFANARRDGDADAVKEAQADIAKFNEKNPGRRITVPQMMASVRARQMRIDQAKDGIYLPKNRTDARDVGRFAIEQ